MYRSSYFQLNPYIHLIIGTQLIDRSGQTNEFEFPSFKVFCMLHEDTIDSKQKTQVTNFR
jgi:hypothetical protein